MSGRQVMDFASGIPKVIGNSVSGRRKQESTNFRHFDISRLFVSFKNRISGSIGSMLYHCRADTWRFGRPDVKSLSDWHSWGNEQMFSPQLELPATWNEQCNKSPIVWQCPSLWLLLTHVHAPISYCGWSCFPRTICRGS